LQHLSNCGQVIRPQGSVSSPFSTSVPLLVTPKQSSTLYHWLTPGFYKDKVKANVLLLPPHM